MAYVPTIIEQRYQEAVDRLSVREKIAQSFAMFDWARSWIARQIVEERGVMDTERLRWEVALRVYGDEPGARQLIERHLVGSSIMYPPETFRETVAFWILGSHSSLISIRGR